MSVSYCIYPIYPTVCFQDFHLRVTNYNTTRKAGGGGETNSLVKRAALNIIKQVYLNRSSRNVLAVSIF